MKKMLSYDFVKDMFGKESYALLSKEYKNAHTKLEFICNNGHKSYITYSNFKAGKRCKFCSHNAPVNCNVVKKAFKAKGYKLISTGYISAVTELNYICLEGHEGSTSWNNFQQGHGCPKCYGNDKLTIEHVRESFKSRAAELLSSEYINSKTKLDYVCSNGHNHSITWDSWRVGHGCQTCAIIIHIGPGNPSWKGGVSFEPYCEVWKDKEYKKSIKQRDDNKCLNTYCNSKDPTDLTIHHIDYNKKNCGPNNLITICRSCNSKANKDRSWHEAWYKAILNRRGLCNNGWRRLL